jgi:prepilin-type N-terminal cleavage/methylation domain-containing protein
MKARVERRAGGPCGRAGFTLLEVVVAMWALGILLLVGVGTLLGVIKVEQAAVAVDRNLTERAALSDVFRTDVANAVSAPDSAGPTRAGPTCLILQTPGQERIEYRWENGKLERSQSNGSKTSRRRVPTGSAVTHVEFLRQGAYGRLITLRLTESIGPAQVKRHTAIAAALEGDLR